MKLSRQAAVCAASILLVGGAASAFPGNAIAGPKGGDPQRDGPADGPRGQRVTAAEHPVDLAEFWDEAARIGNPQKGDVVPNQYIVVFKPGTASPHDKAREITAQNGGQLKFSYGHALHGFAAVIDPSRIDNVLSHPNVLY